MPKLQSSISIESLKPLIDELIRDKPNAIKVKKMMAEHGLEYSNDPIQQMGVVLSVMSDLTPPSRNRKITGEVDL